MKVDFYQLSRDPAEAAVLQLATRVAASDERLLICSADIAQLDRISERLWAAKDSFLAHGMAGGAHDDRQPILLSAEPVPANDAKFLMIADGVWCEGETAFERVFYIFGESTLQGARDCWRMLGAREDVERHFWKQDGGKWVEGP